MRITRRHKILIASALLLLLLLFALVLFWPKIAAILRLVLLGALFAYVLTPVSEWLERHMKRTIAIILLFLSLISILVLFFVFFLPNFFKETMVLAERIPELIKDARDYLRGFQSSLSRLGLPESLHDSIADYSETLEEKIVGFFTGLLDGGIRALGILPDLFIVPVLGFYILKDREYFSKVVLDFIPSHRRTSFSKIAGEVHRILHQFIRGQVFVSLIIATLSTIGYLIIGLPYAMVLGIIAGALEIIPYFGPWLGAIPAVLTAIIISPGKTVWTIVVIVIIQQLENTLITPKILGNQVNLHPVYVILALWTGGLFFGIVGMFFAVPVLLIFRILFKHAYLGIVAIK